MIENLLLAVPFDPICPAERWKGFPHFVRDRHLQGDPSADALRWQMGLAQIFKTSSGWDQEAFYGLNSFIMCLVV